MTQKDRRQSSVVFFCTHGIGDLVMTISVAKLLVVNGYDVSLLVKGPTEQKLAQHISGNHWNEVRCRSEFGSGPLTQALGILRWLRRMSFDYGFAQYGVNPALYSILVFVGGVGCRIGWKGRMSFLNSHSLAVGNGHKVVETAQYLDFLNIEYDPDNLLYAREELASRRDPRIVSIAPGSGEMAIHRRWPSLEFIELVRRLVRTNGVRVELVGGPDEVGLCEEIRTAVGSSAVDNLAGKLSIEETMDRIQAADVLVANCNGISHVGAAVGTYVVGLYGPTDPALTGPYTRSLTTVSVGMDCSPCFAEGFYEGCGNPVCMKDIDVEVVLDAVLQRLSSC